MKEKTLADTILDRVFKTEPECEECNLQCMLGCDVGEDIDEDEDPCEDCENTGACSDCEFNPEREDDIDEGYEDALHNRNRRCNCGNCGYCEGYNEAFPFVNQPD